MPPETDNLKLEELYLADQADRAKVYSSPTEIEGLQRRDVARRDEVLEMMSRGDVGTANDLYHAGVILLHSAQPRDFLTAHRMATISAIMGHKGSRWLVAASLDRFLMAISQPQVYGTQFEHNPEDNRYQLRLPIDDAAVLSFEKKFFGVPLVVERLAQLNGRIQ